jgi:hypothetical protein
LWGAISEEEFDQAVDKVEAEQQTPQSRSAPRVNRLFDPRRRMPEKSFGLLAVDLEPRP